MSDKTLIDEMALIGNCILRKDAHLTLDVEPSDFLDNFLARVWEWMQTVKSIEPVDVEREFYDQRNAIADCISSDLHGTAESLAKRVKEAAHKRRVLESIKTAYKALEGGSDIHTAVDYVLSAADNVSSGEGWKHLNDYLVPAYFDIESAQVNGVSNNHISTGFKDFDKEFGGLQVDGLVVVAGRPSMGKSSFMSAVCRNVAQDKPVLMLSMEMSGKQLALRYYASESSVDLQLMMQGKLNPSDWRKLSKAQTRLMDSGIHINEQRCRSVTDIVAEARRFKRVHDNVGLVAIDYLGLIEMASKFGKNDAISEVTRKLAGLAGELKCPVMLLSQLNRDLEKRSCKKPMMADLRDSGAIEQDADQIIFPFRPEVYDDNPDLKGVAIVVMAKNRHGQTGEIAMKWHAKSATFHDFDKVISDD